MLPCRRKIYTIHIFFHLKHSEKLLLENYRETVFSKLNIKKKLEINFSVFIIKEYCIWIWNLVFLFIILIFFISGCYFIFEYEI